MRVSWWFIVAGILGASGVAFGAFHAHGLQKVLASRIEDVSRITQRMDQFETAVRYQMFHVLAILAMAVLVHTAGGRLAGIANTFFLIGTLLFCGSLYAIVATDDSYYGRITPLGGLALMVGWLLVAAQGYSLAR